MRIVFLSDHETLGGAAVAASRLAEALLCAKPPSEGGRRVSANEVTRLVLFPAGGRHPWRTVALGEENPFARLTRRMARKLVWPGLPRPGTPAFVAERLRRALGKLRPDIIHIHNLHGGTAWGWGPEMAAACAEFAPVVWTLHDMWSFTGRCAYAYDCRRFEQGCDASCPTPDEAPRLAPELILGAWERRREMLAKHPNMIAVTPSQWLARQALAGLWAGHRVETIANGVPTHVYRPIDRLEARRQLGIAATGLVVLVVAQDLTERRKGAGMFPALWRHVQTPFTLVTMGDGCLATSAASQSQALGYIADDETKALAYSAANVLLHPAPVDNFPNVILEAMACGTPAVALPVGGIPEMVCPGMNGWLAKLATAQSLGETLEQALCEIRAGRDLRAMCRETAVKHFSANTQAERHELLYKEAVEAGDVTSNLAYTCRPGAVVAPGARR